MSTGTIGLLIFFVRQGRRLTNFVDCVDPIFCTVDFHIYSRKSINVDQSVIVQLV